MLVGGVAVVVVITAGAIMAAFAVCSSRVGEHRERKQQGQNQDKKSFHNITSILPDFTTGGREWQGKEGKYEQGKDIP